LLTQCPRIFLGDIKVLEHCPNITQFFARETAITGEENSRTFPQRRTSYPKSCFRERSSGDIGVLANCKALSVFHVEHCRGITGKFPGLFFCGPVL
jgi:hypothetical protein